MIRLEWQGIDGEFVGFWETVGIEIVKRRSYVCFGWENEDGDLVEVVVTRAAALGLISKLQEVCDSPGADWAEEVGA